METRNLVKQSVSQNAFLVVQKALLRYLQDANAALVLSNLVSLRDYFESINQLVDNEWFFQTIERMQYDLGLTAAKQSHAIKLLEDKGLIRTKNMGRPCTRHFKVEDEMILSLLQTSGESTEKLEKEKYYRNLNAALQGEDLFESIEKVRDNMAKDLFAVIYCVVRALKPLFLLSLTPVEIGRLRGFYMRESANKTFDYPRLKTALTNILHQKRNIPTTSLYITEIINQYYNTAPSGPFAIEKVIKEGPEKFIASCKV